MQKPWEKYGAPSATSVGRIIADPYAAKDESRKDSADSRADAAAALAQRNADRQDAASRRQAENDAARLQIERDRLHLQEAGQTGAKLTAKERSDAIAGYKSGEAVERLVGDLERLYRQGPGATKGVMGLTDYLPSTVNKRFDNAGNAARGNVGTALNFTGGQLNTATEAAMSVGPYLPQAGDRDEVILDKIARLKQLSIDARDRTTQILGGVPDVNGRVTPVQQKAPVAAPVGVDHTSAISAGDGAAPAPVEMRAATGDMRNVASPEGNAIINAAVRNGRSLEQVNTALSAIGVPAVQADQYQAAIRYHREHPNTRANFGDAQRQVPTTWREWASATAVGTGLGAGLNAAAAGIPAALMGNQDALAAQAAANPKSALAGNVIGGALGAFGGEMAVGAGLARAGVAGAARWAPRVGDALYGTLSGATGSPDDPLTGALIGGAAGVGGGGVGRAATRALGATMRGVTNDSVQYLRRAGVPLTVGQALRGSGAVGSGIAQVEDRLSGIPWVGDVVNARRREGVEAFNRAAFDQSLAPVNATTGGQIGPEGIDAALGLRSQAYRDALDPVNVSIDPQFGTDYAAARASATNLPDDMQQRALANLDLSEQNIGQNGDLTGSGFQQAIRRFRRETGANANLPNGYDLGQVLRQGEDAFNGVLARQAPDALPAYQAANEANRRVETLRSAVDGARNGARSHQVGLFMPSELANAGARSARRFGNSAGTTDQPFYEMTQAGQNILPGHIGDSGTAGRALVTALLGGGAVAGGGAGLDAATGTTGGTETGLGIAALLTLGGTRAGQRLLTSALTERPQAAVRVGNAIYDRANWASLLGVGAATAALPAQ